MVLYFYQYDFKKSFIFFSKVENIAEGEARRYFDHAVVLKNTIQFLRNNKELCVDEENGNSLALGKHNLPFVSCNW